MAPLYGLLSRAGAGVRPVRCLGHRQGRANAQESLLLALEVEQRRLFRKAKL